MKLKILVLLTSMIFSSFFIYAQTDNENVNPKTRDVFCQIIVQQKFMSSKMKMEVDYGEESNLWIGQYGKVRDKQTGKVKKFNSQMDALNYMTEEGWAFVTSYVISNQTSLGTTYAFYYLLKREIPFEGF